MFTYSKVLVSGLLTYSFSMILVAGAKAQNALPSNDSTSIYYNCLATKDVAHLPMNLPVSNALSVWIQAKAVRKGNAELPVHGIVNERTGETVLVSDSDEGGLFFKGSLDFIRFVSGKSSATEEIYKVFIPEQLHLNDRIRFNPFINGGNLVCCLHTNLQGNKRYSEISLISPSFVNFVAPAFTFFRENPALWDEKKQADRVGVTGADRAAARLAGLLEDPNPLIAAWSCRRLLQTGKLPDGAAEKLLASSERAGDPLRVALMADTLLEFSPNTARPGVVALLTKRIETAPTLSVLHGLLLGAWSGGVAKVRDDEGNGSAPPLVWKANVRRRFLTRGGTGAAMANATKPNADEEAIREILKSYGVVPE